MEINEESPNFVEHLKLIINNDDAFQRAKANNSAYIVENNWIVKYFADGHKEKIQKLKDKLIKNEKIY